MLPLLSESMTQRVNLLLSWAAENSLDSASDACVVDLFIIYPDLVLEGKLEAWGREREEPAQWKTVILYIYKKSIFLKFINCMLCVSPE